MSEFIILAIPFIGTSLGSAMVFFLKKRIAPKFEKMLLGFAAGVMIAALKDLKREMLQDFQVDSSKELP